MFLAQCVSPAGRSGLVEAASSGLNARECNIISYVTYPATVLEAFHQ